MNIKCISAEIFKTCLQSVRRRRDQDGSSSLFLKIQGLKNRFRQTSLNQDSLTVREVTRKLEQIERESIIDVDQPLLIFSIEKACFWELTGALNCD